MQKRTSNNYFSFTKKERNGTIFLLFFIGLITCVPLVYPMIFKEKVIDVGSIQQELSILKINHDSTKKYFTKNAEIDNYPSHYQSSEKHYYQNENKGTVFNFDPNTLPADGWKKLGLRDKTITTIQNFISKGGKFRQPEDIKKIWGLHEDQIERLLPYVSIAEKSATVAFEKAVPTSAPFSAKKSFEAIDINLADSAALVRLPGIGAKLSNRILNFRDKLGGFYSVDQVGETFGLQDSVFQKIKASLIIHDKNLKKLILTPLRWMN